MGDGETPMVAEERALIQAKRAAVEQAGTYVESYSQTQNLVLTKDEVNVIAAGIMEVSVLEKKRTVEGDGFKFWVKIRAVVKPEEMSNLAARVKDKQVVEDYNRVQEAYAQSQQEIAILQIKLRESTDSKRQRYYQLQIEASEKYFSNIQLVQNGDYYFSLGHYQQAKEFYLQALGFFSWYNAQSKSINYSFNKPNATHILDLNEALQEYRRYISVYEHIQERLTIIDRM